LSLRVRIRNTQLLQNEESICNRRRTNWDIARTTAKVDNRPQHMWTKKYWKSGEGRSRRALRESSKWSEWGSKRSTANRG